MALSDPELDLLREALEDEPGSKVFVDVAKELIRRDEHSEALHVLWDGVQAEKGSIEGWRLVPPVAMREGRFGYVVEAMEVLKPDPERDPDMVVMHVKSLAEVGQADRARVIAESLLLLHPKYGPIENLLATHKDTDGEIILIDPMITVSRAEQYVNAGRPDRAVRVYRRLVYQNPNHVSLRARLDELTAKPHGTVLDDLSEEIPLPQEPPPEMVLPDLESITINKPSVTSAPERVRTPAPARKRAMPGIEEVRDALHLDDDGFEPGDIDDEPTEILAVPPFIQGEISEFKRKESDDSKEEGQSGWFRKKS